MIELSDMDREADSGVGSSVDKTDLFPVNLIKKYYYSSL